MKCPKCDTKIPDKAILDYVRSMPPARARSLAASLMGRTTGSSKARDPEKMRAAGRAGALKRWDGHQKAEK